MSDSESTSDKNLSVYDAVMAIVDQMASIAWQKLGLQPDVLSGKIVKDLVEAKVAIDVVAQLAAVIEPQLEEDDRRELQNLVRNLRLNFVEKSKGAQ